MFGSAPIDILCIIFIETLSAFLLTNIPNIPPDIAGYNFILIFLIYSLQTIQGKSWGKLLENIFFLNKKKWAYKKKSISPSLLLPLPALDTWFPHGDKLLSSDWTWPSCIVQPIGSIRLSWRHALLRPEAGGRSQDVSQEITRRCSAASWSSLFLKGLSSLRQVPALSTPFRVRWAVLEMRR